MRLDLALLQVTLASMLIGSLASPNLANPSPTLAEHENVAGTMAPVPDQAGKNRDLFQLQLDYARDVVQGGQAANLSRHVRDYFHAVGLPVPDPDKAQAGLNEFDENETLSFTYNLGDVDGDGVDDIALDVWCVTSTTCFQHNFCALLALDPECADQVPPNFALEREQFCGPGQTPPIHRLFLFSGSNGTEIWRRNLGVVTQSDLGEKSCPLELVVGRFPAPDGGQTLLLEAVDAIRGETAFFAIDRRSGEELWRSRTYVRSCIQDSAVSAALNLIGWYETSGVTCENLLVLPILQVPPAQGVPIVSNRTAPALLLDGVGADWTYLGTSGLPSHVDGREIAWSYRPREWMARLSLEDGTELLPPTPTFTPSERGLNRSVFPQTGRYVSGDIYESHSGAALSARSYWSPTPCCSDVTGDGIPDLVYTTTEWNSLPNHNHDGPHLADHRMIAFDGRTGARAWEVLLDHDVPLYQQEEIAAQDACTITTRDETHRRAGGGPTCLNGGWVTAVDLLLLGDADGDGTSDILVKRRYYEFEYKEFTDVHQGTTGRRLWSSPSPRHELSLVMGDAGGDRTNEILSVEWFDWQFPQPTYYDFLNVTARTVTLRNGHDGSVRWQARTFSAPIDLEALVTNYRNNGVPDLNGDGIGEFPVDDPLVLPDLTVVHRWSFLDGREGTPLRRISTVGHFGIPSYAGRLTGNAVDDLAILSGDVNDLWLSLYDGSTGEAVWSRRVVTPHLADFIDASTSVRFIQLDRRAGPDDLLMNFHFRAFVSFRYDNRVDVWEPQVGSFAANNGTAAWGFPRFSDPELAFGVEGPTPASLAFERLTLEAGQSRAVLLFDWGARFPGLMGFVVSGLVCLGVGRRWWWK